MKHDTEGSLQHWVSAVLRIGVMVAGILGAVGLIYYLTNQTGPTPKYGQFLGEGSYRESIGGVFRKALTLDSQSIMQVGILALIATPIARVLVSLIGFVKERDRTYVWITLVVLITLLGSLIGGAIRG